MTKFLGPEEATNVDFAESRRRDQDRVACFLHLRDLVYLYRGAASASAVSFVQTLEAKVIAEKAAREKRLGEVRAREAGREHELVNAVFAAALVMFAIFLGFVGVLAAVKPDVERISYLRQEFLISVWACLAGVLLAGVVSAAALA
jgi:hypothetical protein